METTNNRKLIASAALIVASVALLLGLTFAWFTDTAANKGNKIQAGTLQVALLENGADIGGSPDPVFDHNLWEPGYSTGTALAVRNDGTLAVKYKLGFQFGDMGQSKGIERVIDVYVLDHDGAVTDADVPAGTLAEFADGSKALAEGDLAPGATSDAVNVVLKMNAGAGNEYQGAVANFDILLTATQAPSETDGFGNSDYDKDAAVDFAPVSDGEGLKKALESGKSVSLEQDVVLGEVLKLEGDVVIQGNGNALVVPDGADRVIDVSNASEPVNITLSGVDVKGPDSGSYTRGMSFYGNAEVRLTMDDCSVSASSYALNVASENKNVDLTVKNTVLDGWCAFQTWSPNTRATFDNCTLIGTNDKSEGPSNGFSTVVINEDAGGSAIEFLNCRIEAVETNSNAQTLLSIRSNDNTVTCTGCTFVYNGETVGSEDAPIHRYDNLSGNKLIIDGVDVLA
ncbi:TasA family protein [Eggerthella guodeyinii]|nr:TasA family protein [Eggerthella guodeyinii]